MVLFQPTPTNIGPGIILFWLYLFLSTGCSGADSAGVGQVSADAPGFVQLREAFFLPSCSAGACHSGAVGVAGLSFDDPEQAYETLVGGMPKNSRAQEMGLALVTKGEPNQSFLYRKLTTDFISLANESLGAPMPLGGVNAAGPKTVQALEDWILAGAPYEGLSVEADFTLVEDGDYYVPCDAEDEAGLVACFGEEPNPEEVLRLRTSPITVEAGKEVLVCSHLALTPEEDIYFRGMKGMQMSGGHHVALYAAFQPVDTTEPFPCGSGAEMENYRLLAGAFAGKESLVPEDIALRLPAGQQVVIQSHYINPTDKPVTVMDALDLELTNIQDGDVVAENFVINLSAFEIPPDSVGHEATHTCRAGREMDIYTVIGHTHEYGTLLELEWTDTEGNTSLLYSETDGVLMREGGSAVILPEPIHLTPDDTLKVRCRWDNPLDKTLEFPDEMCAAIMYYSPAVGFLVCGESDEAPEIFGGAGDGAGCVPLDAKGNALGVGEACKPGGKECNDNDEARLCLAIFDTAANFCSFLGCEEDADCGEGATCHAQVAGSACVPFSCAD